MKMAFYRVKDLKPDYVLHLIKKAKLFIWMFFPILFLESRLYLL